MVGARWFATPADIALVVCARLATTSLVRHSGFHALSDDDFARVVIAMGFANQPKLDPSGTSWLPFPFWIQGGTMLLLGRSLLVAQLVTVALACLACVLLYATVKACGVSRSGSVIAGLLGSIHPVAAVTGTAMVPELPTAALCAGALVMLQRTEPRWLVASAITVLPATLSRYEAWPVAVAVAGGACMPIPRGLPSLRAGLRLLVCLLALAGPLAWVTWNSHAHGDLLHFHARVASYRAALLGGSATWHAFWTGYPTALAIEVPAFGIAAAVVFWFGKARIVWLRWRRPLTAAAFVTIAMLAADLFGGAPTHHPERVLLAPFLVCWICMTDMLSSSQRPAARRSGITPILALGALLVVLVGRSAWACKLAGVQRRDEVQVGAWINQHVDQRERVLLDPADYGYFAIMAATNSPERIVLARTVDPRSPDTGSPFASERELRTRIAREQVQWLVAKDRDTLGIVAQSHTVVGRWQIGRVEPDAAVR